MRMSHEEKQRSHVRIMASASRLMRERGIEGASVNEVMQLAGMTHGGFYKHFDSKEDLLAAALEQAFADILRMLQPDAGAAEAGAVTRRFEDFYLSAGHVAASGTGCPIAALGGDLARAATPMKAAFGAGVRRISALLSRGRTGVAKTRHAAAMRQLAMMAGAVMIARASDPGTAADMLAACRVRQG